VGPALRHDGVALTSPSSFPSLPLWMTAKAKARHAPRPPAHPGRPRVPAPPAAIRDTAETPGDLPTLAASGESTPLSAHLLVGGEGEVKGGEGGIGAARGSASAAKTGAARGRSRTRHRQAHLPPLLPLPPRRRAAVIFVFLPADEPHHLSSPTPALRPVATKVRTSIPLPFVDAPAFEPRGKRVSHTASPCRRRW
jgi:hypothetical protein